MPRTDPVCVRARVSVCVRVCACARARVCKYTCSLRPGVDVKAEGAGVQGCGGAGNQEGAAGVQETRREHAGGSTQEGARRREHAGIWRGVARCLATAQVEGRDETLHPKL